MHFDNGTSYYNGDINEKTSSEARAPRRIGPYRGAGSFAAQKGEPPCFILCKKAREGCKIRLTQSLQTSASTASSGRIFVLLAFGGGLGLLGKVALLHNASAGRRSAVLVCFLIWLTSSLLWPWVLRHRHVLAPVVLLGLVAAPLLLLPRAEKMHAEGRGSDQPTCVIAASDSMLHGRWPYDESRMWSHNPLSCGPGWVAMQAPFVQSVGYGWTEILMFAGSFGVIGFVLGWSRLAGLLSLLALAPGLWVAAGDGTDFLPFGLLVAAVSLLAWRTTWGAALLAFFLGLLTQFRAATVLMPATLTRRIGATTSWAASGLAIAVQAAFLFSNPVKFTKEGPMHLFSKLTGGQFPQATPLLLALGYVVLAVLATVAVQLLSRRIAPPVLLEGYLLLIFAVPAALNLAGSFGRHGWSLDSLGLWEGANWIVGCLPLAALLLVQSSLPRETMPGAVIRSAENVSMATPD